MNIIQLHERVRFWADIVGSSRFEASDIDNAVNSAMNDIVEEKYQGSRLQAKGDSFQRTQKLRDELSALVKKSDSSVVGAISFTTPAGPHSLIPVASLPTDYKYLLAIAMFNTAGTTKYNCWPVTHDRINIIDSNPFRRPRLTPIPKQYYVEGSDGITIMHVIVPAPAKAVIYYLAEATQWKSGSERTALDVFVPGTIVIVSSLEAVYAGTTYYIGDQVTIQAPNLQITSGTVMESYVNSDINKNLHELIARKGAINALLSIKEDDKAKNLFQYFN